VNNKKSKSITFINAQYIFLRLCESSADLNAVRSLQRITRSVSSVSLSNILLKLIDEIMSFVLKCNMHIYTSIHRKRTKILSIKNYLYQ